MRIVLLGPPGAGKGTQAVRLAERVHGVYLATGNVLRDARDALTPLGAEAKPYMDRGDNVPDDLVIRIVADRLTQPDADNFVLDGFPRTLAQALALAGILDDAGRPLDRVLFLDVPLRVVTTRLTGRRTCPTCHRTYHVVSNPPLSDEVCDDDESPLVTRPDDAPETVKRRLAVYREQTEQLVDHYDGLGLLARIDGTGPVDEIAARMDEALA